MHRFLELRRNGNPLALVALYAAGLTCTIAWTELLPGEPPYEGPGLTAPIAISFAALVVFFMARGAWAAWRLALFAHIFGLVLALAPAFGGDFSEKAVGLAILQALVLFVLFSPALERHVGARR